MLTRRNNYSGGGTVVQGDQDALYARTTLGDEQFSVSPSMNLQRRSSTQKFEDGVILDREGRTVGVAIDGQIKLAEGVSLRGGLEKIQNVDKGVASLDGQEIDRFRNKNEADVKRIGLGVGKLDLNAERFKSDRGDAVNSFSAVYRIKDNARENFSVGAGTNDMGNKSVNVNYQRRFAAGGLATPPQNILAEGGMLDDSGEVVNGTEVPAGSLTEEVADDVPAMLSEGEFVVPADVVRYVGLERLMKMRDKAKEGLERMEEMGQMGNAEEVDNPDQQFDEMDDDNFENEIDSIMAEVDGDVSMQTERMFAAGGYVSGSDISKATRNPAVDVRYYKHADGRVMYIAHINDKPMTAIPEGFKQVSAEEARKVGKKSEEAANTGGGGTSNANDGGGGGSEGVPSDGSGIGGLGPTGLASAGLSLMALSETLSKAPSVTGKVLGAVTGAIGKGVADQSIAQTTQGFEAMTSAATVPGISSVSGKQGQVTTFSSPATIAAADNAMFGLDQAAKTGMTTNNMGQTVSNSATIAAQDASMGGVSTSIGVGDVSEAAATGMTSVGGVSVSNDATVAAQDAAMFGDDSEGSDGGEGGDSGGTYCCSRMVHLGEWTETKELARMHIWHHKQPQWWKAGYEIWGKVVADTLFKKKGFWTDVMNAFYARHIKKKPHTLKSVIADLVIYPGVFVCGMIWRNAPETTRFVTEAEMK